MTNVRPKDLPAATSPASDDKLVIDGVANGTRALPASAISRKLFTWNGTDTSQFDAPIYEKSAGAAVTPSVAVVAATLTPNKNVLKLLATGTIANTERLGVFLAVKAASLALGSLRRYVIRLVIGQRNTGSGADFRSCGIGFLAGLVGGVDWYVNHIGPTDNNQSGTSTSANMHHLRIDGGVAPPNNVIDGGSTAWLAPDADGYLVELEVDGTDGSPPKFRVWTKGYAGIGGTMKTVIRGEDDFGLAAFPAGWNALALDRVGITMFVLGNGGSIVDPYYEISEFSIFKHPKDE